MTTSEAAEKWGVPKRTVEHWCATGKIRAEKVDGQMWLIPKEEEPPDDYRRQKHD